jgi:hypothetical protein
MTSIFNKLPQLKIEQLPGKEVARIVLAKPTMLSMKTEGGINLSGKFPAACLVCHSSGKPEYKNPLDSGSSPE